MKKIALYSMGMLLSLGAFQPISCMDEKKNSQKLEFISFEQATRVYGIENIGHITERFGVRGERDRNRSVADDLAKKIRPFIGHNRYGKLTFNNIPLYDKSVKNDIISRHMATKTADEQQRVHETVQVELDNDVSFTVFFPRYMSLGNTREHFWYYVPITTQDVADALKIKKSKKLKK
jgi:hypothetical protein